MQESLTFDGMTLMSSFGFCFLTLNTCVSIYLAKTYFYLISIVLLDLLVCEILYAFILGIHNIIE